jgi:hypothetical protein
MSSFSLLTYVLGCRMPGSTALLPLGRTDILGVEEKLTSLLVAHQDTGLDAPLKEAQDLCRRMTSRIGPGSDAVRASERILHADIQHAAFLRSEDLATLHEAIRCYEDITVSDPVLSRRLSLGHGRALATLYDHEIGIEHAEKAMQLLNSVLVETVDDEVAAHALCYLTALKLKTQLDGEGHCSMVDDDTLRIDELLKKSWRTYLHIELLRTRALIATRVSEVDLDLKAMEDWDRFSSAALGACPPEHFLLPQVYLSLSNLYDMRNQLSGDMEDLNRAVILAGQGLEMSSLTSFGRHTLLCVRARLLGRQSRVTGDLNLLEDAIELTREAITLCPSKHRAYPVHVSGLMFLLGTHFESTGRIECLDLDSVIKSPWLACNVATAMRDRAQVASPGTAITLLQRAIRILRARSQPSANLFIHEKAAIYHELGAVYDLQAELGIEIDHESRLQLARDAVETGRDSFEGRTEAKIGLVRALLHQASHTTNASLAEEAEDLIRDELKDDQLLDHLRASLTALQAELLVVRSAMHKIPIELSAAWHAFETIVSDTSARPRDRLRIAIRWATLAESIDAKFALLAYRHAVDVLPQVGYIGEDLIGRIQALRQARDLAPRSASLALSIGEVRQAIGLLEHSRGVLWQQSLHLRPPLHLLPSHLASQLADVSKILDSNETNAAQRRQAAEGFQSIVLEIRSEPGYENFLLPRTHDQLVEKLPEGFVVWLIPSKAHCDVIIVDSRANPQTIHFRHAGLNFDRLQAIATAFGTVHVSALRSIDRKTRPAHLPEDDGASQSHELLLEELWTSLVQRVIRTLDISVSTFLILEGSICLTVH